MVKVRRSNLVREDSDVMLSRWDVWIYEVNARRSQKFRDAYTG